MISLYKIESKKVTPSDNFKQGDERISLEIRGLFSDTKPTTIGSKPIDNGSVFIEMDTGTVYLYDLENQEWNEV